MCTSVIHAVCLVFCQSTTVPQKAIDIMSYTCTWGLSKWLTWSPIYIQMLSAERNNRAQYMSSQVCYICMTVNHVLCIDAAKCFTPCLSPLLLPFKAPLVFISKQNILTFFFVFYILFSAKMSVAQITLLLILFCLPFSFHLCFSRFRGLRWYM